MKQPAHAPTPARTAIVLLLAGIDSLASAQPAPSPSQPPANEAKLAPIYWPEAGRPPLRYAVAEKLFDRIPMDFGMLEGAGFKWTTNIPDRWFPLNRTPSRFSIAFSAKSSEPLTLGVTVFNRDEFMPDLSAQTWERFLDGLREQNGAAFRIIAQTSTIEDPLQGPSIFGEPTRELFCQVKSLPTGVVSQLCLFLIHRGKLLAFSLTGPESIVQAHAEEFRLLVGQFAEE